MAQPLPDALREKIKQRLNFYEDIGLAPFYREPSQGVFRAVTALSTPSTQEESHLPKPRPSSENPNSNVGARHAVPVRATIPSTEESLLSATQKTPSFFASLARIENDTLLKIREDLGDCTRCKLHKKRNHIVFADGNPNADLVFVGEGPGADEDATGIPFVGRAGKLLTQMIEAMGLQRKDVYICNVVKCRPPENRQPEPDEVTTCSPFLVRQLEVVNPKVIVCLGATAAQTILETTQGISKFRGQWQDFRGKKLLATYHPAYLLRNPAAKADVWKDLQKVMAELGLEVKKTKPA